MGVGIMACFIGLWMGRLCKPSCVGTTTTGTAEYQLASWGDGKYPTADILRTATALKIFSHRANIFKKRQSLS